MQDSSTAINRVSMPVVQYGLSSPVLVPSEIDWEWDYSTTNLGDLVAMSDTELATVDPLVMNLIVAKGIPELADLKIDQYQDILNDWTNDFASRCLPRWEPDFHRRPFDYRKDIRFFRLGMVCQYLDQQIGIRYNQEQREVSAILYVNPSDLFLNGVLDTLEGTCGTMSALQVAIGWRMRWPVSLACVRSHFIVRYDDGTTVHNIEATQTGISAFCADNDEKQIRRNALTRAAVASGSDLRALRPRELLGAFVGLRARHLVDIARHRGDEAMILASEPDWLLARQLFPASRHIYKNHVALTTMRGERLFEPDEIGHPRSFGLCLKEIHADRARGWRLSGSLPQVSADSH